jgi:predicted NACHT family NTPase
MAKRSIQASVTGIQQAKRAFSLTGWTQENLAGEVNLKTRQPIWRFFTGQPIDRQIFMEICSVLDLEWRVIALDPPNDFLDLEDRAVVLDIDQWVQQVRLNHREQIQNQCGILQLPNMSHPITIGDIFVDVNTLESISNRPWISNPFGQSPRGHDDDLSRLGYEQADPVVESGIQAVQRQSKLRLLGKPGIGKTTFLQHLVTQCNQGHFAIGQVPIFITARAFAEESRRDGEFSLYDYIKSHYFGSEQKNSDFLETFLKSGHIFLAIDGLDEVLDIDRMLVLKEIRQFSEEYHLNRFIVSCRIADQKLQIKGFTDIEIAPFNQNQINAYIKNWFSAFGAKSILTDQNSSDQSPSKELIGILELSYNYQLYQFVSTPLFLHLSCWIFQGKGRLPSKRSEFYKQILDLLLGQWDEMRGVERDDVYQQFLVPQKIRLLSQLALITLERKQFVFERQILEMYIKDYLRTIPQSKLEPEELQIQCEIVLAAIETQNGFLVEQSQGLLSFSYWGIRDYFAARSVVDSHNLIILKQSLNKLVEHIVDPIWADVFLLTTEMIRCPDSFLKLMEQKIDLIKSQDLDLQEFLAITHQNEITITTEPHWLDISCSDWMERLATTNTEGDDGLSLRLFDVPQTQILHDYHTASQLLLRCLNSSCQVTNFTRKELEITLLLPSKSL